MWVTTPPGSTYFKEKLRKSSDNNSIDKRWDKIWDSLKVRIAFWTSFFIGFLTTLLFSIYYFANYIFSIYNVLLNWDILTGWALGIAMGLVITSCAFASLEALYNWAKITAKILIMMCTQQPSDGRNKYGSRLCHLLSFAIVAFLFLRGYNLISQVFAAGLAQVRGSGIFVTSIFDHAAMMPLIGIMLILIFAKLSDINWLINSLKNLIYDVVVFICRFIQQDSVKQGLAKKAERIDDVGSKIIDKQRDWTKIAKAASILVMISPAIGVIFDIGLDVMPLYAWILLWVVGSTMFVVFELRLDRLCKKANQQYSYKYHAENTDKLLIGSVIALISRAFIVPMSCLTVEFVKIAAQVTAAGRLGASQLTILEADGAIAAGYSMPDLDDVPSSPQPRGA